MKQWIRNDHFINDFSLTIEIRRKFLSAAIEFFFIGLQHFFAHATTAELSWHVQNFVAITVLKSRKTKA